MSYGDFEHRTAWKPQPGRQYAFHGANDLFFKLDGEVVECAEDESDGYRSMMLDLYLAEAGQRHIFFKTPVDTVTVEEAPSSLPDEYGEFRGWQIVSTSPDRHVWVTMGTANSDDYYPGFRFNYTPRKEAA